MSSESATMFARSGTSLSGAIDGSSDGEKNWLWLGVSDTIGDKVSRNRWFRRPVSPRCRPESGRVAAVEIQQRHKFEDLIASERRRVVAEVAHLGEHDEGVVQVLERGVVDAKRGVEQHQRSRGREQILSVHVAEQRKHVFRHERPKRANGVDRGLEGGVEQGQHRGRVLCEVEKDAIFRILSAQVHKHKMEQQGPHRQIDTLEVFGHHVDDKPADVDFWLLKVAVYVIGQLFLPVEQAHHEVVHDRQDVAGRLARVQPAEDVCVDLGDFHTVANKLCLREDVMFAAWWRIRHVEVVGQLCGDVVVGERERQPSFGRQHPLKNIHGPPESATMLELVPIDGVFADVDMEAKDQRCT
ncbi:hypothetical protein OGATHE_004792 [Ogataea polymorpha]|uniref:Uncharacterized protein n=1 Tax=Ogataea polymorpha TaxID=460523 RepID=A0A9P8T2W8_9ASCO|nr:hypothetical protein OGATHE_004792 [Ogataea polymorpha]